MSTAYDAHVLSRAPALYWPLSEDAVGSTVGAAIDTSGNGRDGAPLTAGVATAPVTRAARSSYQVGAVNAALLQRSAVGIGPDHTRGVTLECWFAFDADASTAQYPFIISSGRGDVESCVGVYYLQANRQFTLRAGHYLSSRDFPLISFPSHPIGQVFHIVAIQDVGGGVRAFVNGVKVLSNSTPWTVAIEDQVFQVGGASNGLAQFRSGGHISNVAVYTRPLTDEEVYENFRKGSSEYDELVLDGQPYLYWRLNEAASGAHGKAYDCSPNGRHSAATYQTQGAAPFVLRSRGSVLLPANYACITGSPTATWPGVAPSTTGLTYACWVKFTSQTASGSGPTPVFMSQGPEYANGGTYLMYSAPDKRFVFRVGNNSGDRDALGPTMSSTPLPDSIFFIVGTLDEDGAARLYVNGELGPVVREGPWFSPDTSGSEFRVGNNTNATTYFYHGLVSSAVVYTRPLSAVEIANLYAAGIRNLRGNALVGGAPYDMVYAFDSATMLLAGQGVPDPLGDYMVVISGPADAVYVTVTKEGVRPKTHGPVLL